MQRIDELQHQTCRLFEATCPPAGSGLNSPVPMQPVRVDANEVEAAVLGLTSACGITSAICWRSQPTNALSVYVTPSTVHSSGVQTKLRSLLHDYLLPHEVICCDVLPRDQNAGKGSCDGGPRMDKPLTDTEKIVQRLWGEVLGSGSDAVRDLNADFFECGGSSLLGGRLIAQIRKQTGAPLTAADIFTSRTISALAYAVDNLRATAPQSHDKTVEGTAHDAPVPDSSGKANIKTGKKRWMKPQSQTSALALAVQALPLMLFYPVRRGGSWVLFVMMWMLIQSTISVERLISLVMALALTYTMSEAALPLIGILGKWLLVGRFRQGRYPLWGQYYLRWWLVDQLLQLCGRGFFRLTPITLRFYYRLLGAKVGKGVIIDRHAKLGEFDLLDIGEDVLIDKTALRGFCFDEGAMALRRVTLGRRCVICAKVSVNTN
mmetsp:Transcript_37306/g.99407  ORF Transcript_37306/g.99407 Transcript_37306/m.99407 type:complete len:434 (-) Transcript_37306:1119-2420(-)